MVIRLVPFSGLHNRVQLVKADDIPHTFQEISIQSGYRKPRCSPVDCLISAFAPLNNETLNFWTHFLPFWYFAWTLKQFLGDYDFRHDSYHWPFLAYMFTVTLWPIASCMAHLFSVMSEEARHFCFFVDYLGLSWYSFGVSIAYHAYSFERHFFDRWYSVLFPYITAITALLCVLLSCYSRFIPKELFWRRKVVRSAGFALPYFVVNYPLLHRIYLCRTGAVKCVEAAINGHCKQFISSAIAFFLYNFHVPERLSPGTFDLFGHSHQLFHVCGVASSYYQLWALVDDMKARRHFFETHGHPAVSAFGTVDALMVAGVLLGNSIIVAYFTRQLCRRPLKLKSS